MASQLGRATIYIDSQPSGSLKVTVILDPMQLDLSGLVVQEHFLPRPPATGTLHKDTWAVLEELKAFLQK